MLLSWSRRMTSPTRLKSCCDGDGQDPVAGSTRNSLFCGKDFSIDDASWIPSSNFTYARELDKMVKRDKPEEVPG